MSRGTNTFRYVGSSGSREGVRGAVIEEDSILQDLIQSETIQSLKYKRQLSFCDGIVTNPYSKERTSGHYNANYSRFAHSIHVLENTQYAISVVDGINIDEKNIIYLKIGALTHDSGHPSYSHTIEDLGGARSHEEHTKEIITTGEIADILEKHCLDPKEAAKVAIGKNKISEIITGEVGIDRVTYEEDDMKAIGYSLTFQPESVIRSYRFDRSGKFLVYEDRFQFGKEVIQLLKDRSFLSDKLYSSVPNRSGSTMIRRAVEEALINTELEQSDIYKLQEEELLDFLKQSKNKLTSSLGKNLSLGRYFWDMFDEIIKQDFHEDVIIRIKNNSEERIEIEEKLSKKIGCTTLIDTMRLPEPPKGEIDVIIKDQGNKEKQLREWNKDTFDSIVSYHNQILRRFYVFLSPYPDVSPKDVKREVFNELGMDDNDIEKRVRLTP